MTEEQEQLIPFDWDRGTLARHRPFLLAGKPATPGARHKRIVGLVGGRGLQKSRNPRRPSRNNNTGNSTTLVPLAALFQALALPDAMTSLRPFCPQDLLNMNFTNLDPLTENYNLDFYMQYLMRWPSLFTVAEDQHGNIVGYSKQSSSRMFLLCSS